MGFTGVIDITSAFIAIASIIGMTCRSHPSEQESSKRDGLVCKIRYLRGDTRDTCFIFMRGGRERVLAYSKHKLLLAG